MNRYSVAVNRFLVAAPLGTGAVALLWALASERGGLASSAGLDSRSAVLLVVGCDLLIAALIVGARRRPRTRQRDPDLALLLSGAIGEGVMIFALTAAAVIGLYGQSEPVERLGYVLAIVVVVPLCVTLAWRRQRRGIAEERQRFIALATLASTAGALYLARWHTAPATMGISISRFLFLELVVARTAIALLSHHLRAAWLRRIPPTIGYAAIPALLVLAAGPFIPTPTFDFVNLAIPIGATLGTLATFYLFRGRRARGLPRAGRHGVDAGALIISMLVIFYAGRGGPLEENQDYFLGPAIDVIHGHPMLVSTFSQYGVGMMDALAAVFLVVPIGYGTLTLLISGLTVLFFVLFYVILRWSTRSLLLAVLGLSTEVTLYMFSGAYFYTYFPSTGVLRFGLPWIVILCSLAALRAPRHQRLLDGLVLVVVAIASVWSGETGIYCIGTAGALTCMNAAMSDGSRADRWRKAAGRIGLLLAVSVLSISGFSAATRISAGAWPDWHEYLEYLKLAGEFSALPIEPWSLGLAIGAFYVASAIALILIAMVRPTIVKERPLAFAAATGLTALGTLVYTYFLDRSHPENLIHISPPLIALMFLWLDIIRSSLKTYTSAAVVCAAGILVAGLVLTGEREAIGEKYSSTALAAVLGEGAPIESRLRALWSEPTAKPEAAAQAVAFVESLRPKPKSITLLLAAAVVPEVLVHLDTSNALDSSNPFQVDAMARLAVPRIVQSVAALPPGGIIVTSDSEVLLPTQQFTLALLQRRFLLQLVASNGRGLHAYLMTSPQ